MRVARTATPPASVLDKTHWRVRGRRVLISRTRTSSPSQSVDTAGYIYYIRVRIRQRRISGRGAASKAATAGRLIPESMGINA